MTLPVTFCPVGLAFVILLGFVVIRPPSGIVAARVLHVVAGLCGLITGLDLLLFCFFSSSGTGRVQPPWSEIVNRMMSQYLLGTLAGVVLVVVAIYLFAMAVLVGRRQR